MSSALRVILGVVLLGSMLFLVLMLSDGAKGGVEAIEKFADPIRAGAKVSAGVAGAEADALSEALRKSKSISITNFQAQDDTGCFWVDLGGVSATFELRESGDTWEVVHATLTRDCECPDSADEPCHLE